MRFSRSKFLKRTMMLTGTPNIDAIKPTFLYIQKRSAWWIIGGLSRAIFTWQPSITRTPMWRYVHPYLPSNTCTSMCTRDLIVLLPLLKGGWICLARKITRRWSLPMVSGKTPMKLKHTLKDVMYVLPRHCGIFSPLKCMTRHLRHTPCRARAWTTYGRVQ
jgi:hypothetical protein